MKMDHGILETNDGFEFRSFADNRDMIITQMLIFRLRENIEENARNQILCLLQQEYNLFQYLFDNYGGVEPQGGYSWIAVPDEFSIQLSPPFGPSLNIPDPGLESGSEGRAVWVRSQLGRMLKFRGDFPPQFVRAIVEIILAEIPDFPLDNDLL